MTYTKRILCLANSKKPGGRCIAGREVVKGRLTDWIRPVSNRPEQSINDEERRYKNGDSASVLDFIDITFESHQPHNFQTENHLIAPVKWSKKGAANWAILQKIIDNVTGPLWHNGESAGYGLNDRVNETRANKLRSSLMLIKPDDVHIHVGKESRGLAVRAHFNYSESSYIIKVTDPIATKKYKSRGIGDYPLDNALFCLSLGETFQGYAYKLVAAIFTENTVGKDE